MKANNPPLPPFRKGGMEGFEIYDLCHLFLICVIRELYRALKKELDNYKLKSYKLSCRL
jgi:hypothetical protein